MVDERRCPACGALNTDDAQWCGQCFAPLHEPEPASQPEHRAVPATAGAVAIGAPGPGDRPTQPERAPFWPCTVCGEENALEADACATCGTPFAQVMRGVSERRTADPDAAFRRSLLFPGLGHRMVGRGMDGLARGVLFAVAFGMTILTGVGTKTAVTILIFVAFAATALAVYIGTAIEAKRLAAGDRLLVSSRTLMWVLVGLVFASVVLLGFSVVSALRR